MLAQTMQMNSKLGRLCRKLAFKVDDKKVMDKDLEPTRAFLSHLGQLREIEVRHGLGIH